MKELIEFGNLIFAPIKHLILFPSTLQVATPNELFGKPEIIGTEFSRLLSISFTIASD